MAEGYILNEPEQRSIFAAGPAQKSILKISIKISWTNTLRKNLPISLLTGCDNEHYESVNFVVPRL